MRLALSASIVALALLVGNAARAAPDAKAVRLWKAKCASCHGADGKAQTETGAKLKIPDMSTAAWQKKVTDEKAKSAILDGVKRPDGEGMDPFRDKLEPEQVDALVAVVRSFGG
jgi:mono/diheme cytochrome c family protein